MVAKRGNPRPPHRTQKHTHLLFACAHARAGTAATQPAWQALRPYHPCGSVRRTCLAPHDRPTTHHEPLRRMASMACSLQYYYQLQESGVEDVRWRDRERHRDPPPPDAPPTPPTHPTAVAPAAPRPRIHIHAAWRPRTPKQPRRVLDRPRGTIATSQRLYPLSQSPRLPMAPYA